MTNLINPVLLCGGSGTRLWPLSRKSHPKQFTKLFELDGVNLTFEASALDYIVEQADQYKLGARGLRSICEAIMLDAMFDIPSDESQIELKITKEYAEQQISQSTLKKLKVAS